MEEKLYAAASKLPEPRCSFTNLEALAEERKQRKRPNRRKRLILLAMALCLLITACAYGSTKYGLWGGYASNSYKDAKRTAEKFNYTIPETLKESPFQTYSEAHGAPEGYTRLQALLMPTYKLYNVFYAVEKQEIREDGGTYSWQENVISVYFGTTEQEPWKYHFSVAEDGSKNYHGVNPGSKRVVEYEGYTLHLYSVGESHSAMWEDKERMMIIDVSCHDLESQEAVLEIAKELIDLNREEPQETTQ